MSKIENLAASIQELAAPGAKAKDIIAAVRERHPGSSKKDVVQAAFYALTGGQEADPDKVKRIHKLAIEERMTDEPEIDSASKPMKRKHKRKTAAELPA